MPVYSYLCGDCEYEFDAIRNYDDGPRTECERCEGKNAKRIPSRSAPPRGNFGTTPRKASRESQTSFNFPKRSTEAEE